MPYITIGSSSQLQIKAPTKGTTNWSSTMLTDTWTKIAEHNHDGAGNGVQLAAGALADNAITGAKIRLDNNESLDARNQANSGDVSLLKLDTNDELILQQTVGSAEFQDDGLTIVDNADNAKKIALDASAITTANTRTLTMADADVDLAALANSNIAAGAAIDFSKLAALTSGNILVGNGSNVAASVAVSGDITLSNAGVAAIASGVIVNADVNASAAIDASKIHDGSVSNTEFGYLNGVTSAIQTQIDAKLTSPLTTNGDILYYNSSAHQRLAIGTNGQVLQVSSGLPAWTAPPAATDTVTEITSADSPYTLTTSTNTLLVDCTSGNVEVDLYAISGNAGKKVKIIKTDSSTNTLTIDPNGTETIDGSSTSKVMYTQNEMREIQVNNSEDDWVTISRKNDTPWTTYTPGTQGFGTVSSVQVKYKRVGDLCYIQGNFTAGTVSGSQAQVDLPLSTTIAAPTAQTPCGIGARSAAVTNFPVPLAASGNGHLLFGLFDASGLDATNALNGNQVCSNSQRFNFNAVVQISEWED